MIGGDAYGALRLIGWYGSEDHGYSVPLFGQTEGANAVWIARCSVSGDHGGTISGFEAVDVGEHRRLPLGSSVRLAIGDPWHDVFVWDGEAYVGTPDVLWRAFEGDRRELEELAPVSLFELALYAGQDVSDLGRLAFGFVRGRFNEMVARRWRRQFLRQWLETEVRRQQKAHRHDEESYRSVTVAESWSGGLTATLPNAIAGKMNEAGTLRGVSARLVGLGAALGAEVAPLGAGIVDLGTSGSRPPPEGERAESREEPASDQTDVAVVAVGRRARGIVTLLRRSLRARWVLAELADGGETLVGSGVRGRQPKLDWAAVSASTVMIVVDEEDFGRAERHRLDRYLRESVEARGVAIIVPALPVNRPSRVFEGEGSLAELVDKCDAILDTAVARSPFWWGNPKRSFDRRIADVVAVCGAACRSPGLREKLRARGTHGSAPVLAVGLPRTGGERYRGRRESVRLGSEATWVPGGGDDGDRVVLYRSRVSVDGVWGGGGEGEVVAEVRRNMPRFGEFAGAVVAHALARKRSQRVVVAAPVEGTGVPDGISRELAYPGHCRGFHVRSSAGASVNLAVLGERPSVDAVSAADSMGWWIARYTDLATIRRAGEVGDREGALPREIDLGTIRSSWINRQVATRGVDQRDVWRFSHRLFEEWVGGLPAANRRDAREAARPMRSATRHPDEGEGDFVVTREYLARGDDVAAKVLAGLLRREGRYRPDWRTLKRGADLRRCWTMPSEGFRRYGLVDGSIPVIVVQLRLGEVPVEDLFVVDGDAAVPALFRSRVFRIWARATLPSASSWMARFSVTGTFGGFPIVEPFEIRGQEGSPGALVAEGAPGRLQSLVYEVDDEIERRLAEGHASDWKTAYGTTGRAMNRLDEMILDWYGLSKEASSIAILRRLRELNARLR